ncbi:hypothetical protein EVAR_23451_1 [Eumeta japonica]|uniref:Uncharacterized protein n=1 Tax=Eumeta variegata TaxID=151549 RepID=A0A4C1UJR6_EUMVA|nr:hypothetical protein EVAR_23451_1 [Eumeta japonica]
MDVSESCATFTRRPSRGNELPRIADANAAAILIFYEIGGGPQLTKQITCRSCAVAVSLLLGRIGRWSGREIARSALSFARSAQAERDNESCFFVHADPKRGDPRKDQSHGLATSLVEPTKEERNILERRPRTGRCSVGRRGPMTWSRITVGRAWPKTVSRENLVSSLMFSIRYPMAAI